MSLTRLGVLASLSASAAALVVRSPAPLAQHASRFAARSAMMRAGGDAKDDSKEEGHQAPRGTAPELSEADKQLQARVAQHQRTAARLTQAEEARSLIDYARPRFAVISTLSSQLEGYPSGAVVGFAPDERGLPIFCFSGMSSHTVDLLAAADGEAGAKAALTVTAAGFQGAADGRVTLIGDVARVTADDSLEECRAAYKEAHPTAYWVDFGDFSFFRMTELKAVRFIGGFAQAGNISPAAFIDAEVDPIQAFAKPVCTHMNADHGESAVAMVEHYVGLDNIEAATLSSLDRLGMGVQVERAGQTFKLRLPFPRPAADRKDVKALIVEMTKAAADSRTAGG